MRSDFLDDGYTEKGYIAAEPGLHGALRFEFRPMLLAQRTPLLDRWEKLEPTKRDAIMAEFVTPNLLSWSLTDARGATVPISAANVLRLRPALQGKLVNVIMGLAAGDMDPEATDADRSATAELELRALLANQSVANIREAADAKN